MQANPWWTGIPDGILSPVMYGKLKGEFTVNSEGISWRGPTKGSYVRCPWGALRVIGIDTVQIQHGHGRSAFGFGPVGVAVVAATAIHNARAAKMDIRQRITLTSVMTGGGTKSFVFLTGLPRPVVDSVCMPIINRLRAASEADNQLQAEKKREAAEAEHQRQLQEETAAIAAAIRRPISIADELRKLAELRDASILSAEEFEAQKARLLSQ